MNGLEGPNLLFCKILIREIRDGADLIVNPAAGLHIRPDHPGCRQAIGRFILGYNESAVPFEWTNRKLYKVHPKQYYPD